MDSASGGLAGTGAGVSGDLRSKILAANLAGGTNTILFSCSSAPCTITLTGPLPPITSNLTIAATTFGNIVIDGAGLYRVFFADTGNFVILSLQIQNGLAQGGAGGNGDGGGGGGAGLGGCLFINQASAAVILSNVKFLNCSAAGGQGGSYVNQAYAGGGGGGLVFRGGNSGGVGGGPGGGGVRGQGVDLTTSTNGTVGGAGGGGGGGGNGGTGGAGGSAYSSNAAGSNSGGIIGGAGGFGGGGGGGAFGGGGAGGFGGGGGGSGSNATGANGGPGGGGGGTDSGTNGSGGSLGSGIGGGDAGSGTGGGGGGAAVGPAVFINAGSLTLTNTFATNSTATAGAFGTGNSPLNGGLAGSASSVSLFNYAGTVNSTGTTGPNTVLDTIPTSLSGSATPATVSQGQTVTLSATVTTGSGMPSGTIAFLDGTTQLGSPLAIDGTGTATISGVTLTVGMHIITANFASSDLSHANSSTTFSATVAASVSSVSAPVASGSLVYGQSHTFAVTVMGMGGTPTGSVTILDGTTTLGVTPLAAGSASFSTSTLGAGMHIITAQYGGDSAFSGATSSALAVTITKASLVVTANNASKAYSAPLPAFSTTITGFANGDTAAVVSGTASLTTTATASSAIGTYPITALTGTLAASNYTFTFMNGTLTVGTNVLTVTGNSASKAYGASLPTFTTAITGFVNGDTAAVVSGSAGLSTTATASSAVGAYPITASAGTLAAANYTFAFVNSTLTVTPAILAVTVNSASKVYGAPLPVLSAAITGFVNGDTAAAMSGSASLTTTATASSAPGIYPIVAAAGTLAAANYTFTFVNGTLTVGANILIVTANSVSKTYGASLPAISATITGFVNGDTAAVVSGLASLTTTGTASSGAGTYPIVAAAGTLAAANYTFTFVNGTLTVTPATLTVTASSASKVYGGALPVFSTAVTGFVSGDGASVVSGTASLTTTATTSSAAGTYPITAAAGTLIASNYAFTFINGTLTVTPAALTVTANNVSKIFGAPLPVLSATVAGFVNGDAATAVSGTAALTTTATASSPSGTYPITAAAGTLAASNYTFTFVGGTLTVGPPALTVTANSASKVYGAPLPVFATTISGFVNGNTATVVSGAATLTTTATATSPVGSYPITSAAGTLIAPNYSFTFVNGTLTVAKASTATTLAANGSMASAMVTPVAPGAGTPTGTVQFLNGSTVLSTVPLTGSTASVAAMPGALTANYSGDGNFSGSSGSAQIQPPAVLSLTLSSSLKTSVLGQPVTLTASFQAGGSGASTAQQPGGLVQFFDGPLFLGSVALASGQATYTTNLLGGGVHMIVVQYAATANFPAAQATVNVTVSAPLTTSVTAAPTSAAYGQAVALTFTVTAMVPAGFSAPTGQVVFSLASATPMGANTTLGTASLSSGNATLSVINLAAGVDNVQAQYSGDSAWPAMSSQVKVTISQAGTTSSVLLTAASGQPMLTASIGALAPASGIPTGTVKFIDTVSNAVLGSATLINGRATASPAPSAAVSGRSIAAVYSGDSNYLSSQSAALPAVVNLASNAQGNFAPDEIATMYGVSGLGSDTVGTLPLTTALNGTMVNISDVTGTNRLAPLYGTFGSVNQINFVMPAGTAAGPAVATVMLPGGGTVANYLNIAPITPGLFSVNVSGQSVYVGQIVYVHADASETVVNSTLFSNNTPAYNPISLSSPGDRAYLVLYGSGFRHGSSLTAKVNGVNVPVLYFGVQPAYPGMDQINLGPLPASLAGSGQVKILITVDTQLANTVMADIR